MSSWWINAAGALHVGDPLAGDVAATDAQVEAWQAAQVTLDVVQAECARRIALVVTDNQKLNMLGMMVSVLMGVAVLGGTATDAQKADAASFQASMAWIAAMKGACAGLVGNVNYQADANWPALPDGLAAFGARF